MPTVVSRHWYLWQPGFGPEPKKPLTGRERRPPFPADAIYGGRGTPLGNPFLYERFQLKALTYYRKWLAVSLGVQPLEVVLRDVDDHEARRIIATAIPNDPRILRQMRSIGPETLLVCSCKSKTKFKPCHMDIVESAWLWLRNSGGL